MYFSTIHVGQDVWKYADRVDLLRAEDAYHQFLWSLFAPAPDSQRDFLYRADTQTMPPRFHILSKRPPTELDGLVARTTVFQPVFRKDDLLAFDIRLNPTIQKSRGPNKRSAKHDVVMDAKIAAKNKGEFDERSQYEWVTEAAQEWLIRRGVTRGFEILSSGFHAANYAQQTIRRNGKTRPIQFSTVDCRGTLRITNSEAFQQVVQEGLGSSKAFGCGLWLLKRIPSS